MELLAHTIAARVNNAVTIWWMQYTRVLLLCCPSTGSPMAYVYLIWRVAPPMKWPVVSRALQQDEV